MPEDLSLSASYAPLVAGVERATASGPRAGAWRRFLGSLTDGVLLLALGWCVHIFFGVGWRTFTFQLCSALVSLTYFTYLEGRPSGQTLGKRLAGIRVMDFETGAPLGPGRAAVRDMARAVSALPLGLGYFWMLWDVERRTWHDKLSGSVVVPVDAYPVEHS